MSVGSLYQYFPNKLSLMDAIRQNHRDDCLSIMRKIKVKGLAPMHFVANIIKAMIEAHTTYPGLNRVLFDEAPSSEDYRNHNGGF